MKHYLIIIFTLLGVMYSSHPVANNRSLDELQFLQNEAKKDNAAAQLLFGLAYLNGQQDLKTDITKALYWLRRSAHNDNAYAQYQLGSLYSQGNGVNKDMVNAVKWWHLSAEHENSKAEFLLGKSLLWGNGIKADENMAIMWLEKSAHKNNQDAQLLLRKLYNKGFPVPKKDTIGQGWFSVAMGLNTNESISFYTIIKKSLDYTLQIYKESTEELKQRAQDGDSHAQYELGLRYKNGAWDVSQDKKAALYWIQKAANNNNILARQSLPERYKNAELETVIVEKQQ